MLSWWKTPLASASKLGPLETELLRALWKRGNATVRELLAEGHARAAYTTVMTTLDRLHKKGLLDRAPDGRAYRYSPRHTEAEYNRLLLAGAIQRLLGSSAPLSFLVDAVTEHDAALLPELERAVERKRRELREREKR
ncbi:MAG TPA: BlaI/MecI/CopY family transcriptional regulator [Terriglobales bacterium]|nr:BlaI/MecI/CopY family transcriptional regulator [Terriglobales bacterium]